MEHIRNQSEPDVKTVCGYCGREFEIDENVVEKEVNGRTWRFCDEECYKEFLDKLHYRDDSDAEHDPDAMLPT